MSLVAEEIPHKEDVFSSTWPSILVVVVVGSALLVRYTLNEHYEVFSHPGYAIVFVLNWSLVALLVSFVGHYFWSCSCVLRERVWKQVRNSFSGLYSELVRRMFLVTEEIRQKMTNWKHVFSSTFPFGSGPSILVVAVVGSALFVFFSHPGYAIMFALNCSLVALLVSLVGGREPSSGPGVTLALSYYFDRLKLVLPHLERQIAESEAFRDKLTSKTLFILLPATCLTFNDIGDADDRMQWAGSLPECRISRGGIKAQSYKQAVYRIEMPRLDGGVDRYHFVLEYATPLMNLYDMSTHADVPLSSEERGHQVVLFMHTLRHILDHSPACRGKCELVPIPGTGTNEIADILVGRILCNELDEDVYTN